MNNFFKTRLSFFSSLFEQAVNPKRDWSILIILFVILIILSVGFDIYIYQQIVNGDMYVTVKRDELVIENLKSDDLKNILINFENKKTNITNLKLEDLVDPSL